MQCAHTLARHLLLIYMLITMRHGGTESKSAASLHVHFILSVWYGTYACTVDGLTQPLSGGGANLFPHSADLAVLAVFSLALDSQYLTLRATSKFKLKSIE